MIYRLTKSIDQMKNKTHHISKERKSQILAESNAKGCVITELARKHNVPVKTIYDWRSKQKTHKTSCDSEFFFLEVPIPRAAGTMDLKKVELVFDDYSCSVEGKMSGGKLIKLVQLLQEGIC